MGPRGGGVGKAKKMYKHDLNYNLELFNCYLRIMQIFKCKESLFYHNVKVDFVTRITDVF